MEIIKSSPLLQVTFSLKISFAKIKGHCFGCSAFDISLKFMKRKQFFISV